MELNQCGVPFISTSTIDCKLFETRLFQEVDEQTCHRKRNPIKEASVYPVVPCIVGISFKSKQIYM